MKKRSMISLIVLCVTMFALAIFTACAPKAPTVEEINFKDGTVKSTYTLNEQIDYSNIKLVVSYSDDSTKELSLTDTGVEYTPIDTSSVGQKVLSATYENKLATKNVEVIKSLSSIEFVQNTISKTLVQGSTIDYANIIIKLNYNDGSHDTKNLNKTDFSYTEIDTSVLGKHTFEVTFNNKKINIEIEIVAPKAVVSIEILNLKSVFGQGETINYNEIDIKFNYDDNSNEVKDLNKTDFSYDEIDTDTPGTQDFVVSLKDNAQISATKVLTIQEATVQSIEYFDGLKAEYQVNGTFNDSEVRIKVIKDNNDIEYVYLNDSEVTYNADRTKQGENILSITYGGRFCTTTINVVAVLQGIEFQAKSLTYEFKDEFVKGDIKLNVIYNDPAVNKVISLADEGVTITQPISLTDNNLIGATQTLKVEYMGKTAEIEVIVNKVISDIKFKADTRTNYYLNNDIDYSKIIIVVSYNDDTTEEINLNDSRVIFTQIDITKAGSHKLQVEFMGKLSNEITIEIKDLLSPAQFTIPESYQDYKAKSSTSGPYKLTSDVETNPYLVGSINKFSFVPLTTYYDATLHKIVVIDNPYTIFNLYIKDNGEYKLAEDPTEFVLAEDNMYKFNSNANDKFFKLEIMLDGTKYNLSKWIDNNLDVPKAEIEFKVVDAYNAYDTYGLSVMDNLNVKNWAEIKDRTLVYDDKKLNEYTDVKLVVLHKDIVINADELPSNYFWSEEMYGYNMALTKAKAADSVASGATAFAARLKGSLRNGIGEGNDYSHCDPTHNPPEMVETWGAVNTQKGIFNTNQTSISGNFMTISTKDSETRHLTSILSHYYKEGDVDSMINHVSHWSIFKFFKTDDLVQSESKLNVSIDNLTLQGNMPKTNETGLEAGLIAMNTLVDKMTISNVITTQFYTHIICDGVESIGTCELEFNDSIMTDAYSNMFYLWRSTVSINRSIMKNAGGPLFLLVDADRTSTDTSKGCVLNIDNESQLESFAAGTESWYQMYDAAPLLDSLKALNTILYGTYGKTYVHKVNSVDQINIIAAIIPNPDSIFTSPTNPINIKGKVVRGGVEEFDMESLYAQGIKQYKSVGFISGNRLSLVTDPTSFAITDPMGTGYSKETTSDMLGVILSAALAEKSLTNAPYFGVVLGDYLIQKQDITI